MFVVKKDYSIYVLLSKLFMHGNKILSFFLLRLPLLDVDKEYDKQKLKRQSSCVLNALLYAIKRTAATSNRREEASLLMRQICSRKVFAARDANRQFNFRQQIEPRTMEKLRAL